MNKKKMFLLSAVLLLVLSLVGASVALAQNNTQTPRATLHQLFWEKLAANLGIDVSRLQEAFKVAGSQALDEAIQQGLLPADKAQRLKEAIEKGQWGPMEKFIKWGGPHKFSRGYVGNLFRDIASILGMTPQELKEELKSGKTLEEIASTKGMTLEQLKEKWLTTKKAALDNQVSQGKLSAEKAQQILSRLEKIDFSKLGPRIKGPLTN